MSLTPSDIFKVDVFGEGTICTNLAAKKRKRILGLIIRDVTLLKDKDIQIGICFKGGATNTLYVSLPRPFAQARTTLPETIALIGHLLDTYTEAQVAV